MPALETLPHWSSPAVGDWPLVGREEELQLLERLRAGARVRSAVINGAAGVGKTRLAREAMARVGAAGWAGLEVRASSGLASVPFGPLRTLFEIPPSSNLGELAAAVQTQLLERRSGRGLVVVVDDGHALDVESHLHHIYVKVGVNDRQGLASAPGVGRR